MNRSFINKDNFRYLKAAGILSGLSIILYVLHQPVGPPSGASWLGYTLGTVAALIMVWLAWFGVRKRRYQNTKLSLNTWLSAHVYLGLSLLVIATLHCGFQFDANVHTVAYILMVFTIVSGIFGVYYYLTVPDLLVKNMKGTNPESLRQRLRDIDMVALSLAHEIDSQVHEVILYSIDHRYESKARITMKDVRKLRSVGAQLLSIREVSKARSSEKTPKTFKKKLMESALSINELYRLELSKILIDLSFDRLSGDKLNNLLDFVNEKENCLLKLDLDSRYKNQLKTWLLFHVPLSLAAIISVVIHIVTVFYY
jgi:hypothetical protein